MAQRMRFVVTALLSLAPLLARAEALPDPTRPALATEPGAAAPGAATAPRLLMIKISATRRSAIIDGQEVTIGSRVGDMRVVKITEGEVVLRGKDGAETLQLFSGAMKRPVAAPGPDAKKPGARPAPPARIKTDAGASRKAQE